MKLYFLALVLLFSSICRGGVHVAFFEIHDSNGKLIQFEHGGRFGHVAISYNGGWLEAHPWEGVRWLQNLIEIGVPAEILAHPTLVLDDGQVEGLLGRPYDPTFTWFSSGVYCSKLVALLLGISPFPMSFHAPIWRQKLQGATALGLGISPDDLFNTLIDKGFVRMERSAVCRFLLTKI